MDKQCFKCGQWKTLKEFYRHSRMADGHVGKCKECTKADVSENYQKRKDYYRAFDRKRYHCPHRKAYERARSQISFVRAKHNKSGREWARRNPIKRSAATAVGNAIRAGRLKRQPCEVCGELPTEGHHNDYRKPLEVRWLCKKCHCNHHVVKRERERMSVCPGDLTA